MDQLIIRIRLAPSADPHPHLLLYLLLLNTDSGLRTETGKLKG